MLGLEVVLREIFRLTILISIAPESKLPPRRARVNDPKAHR